MADTQTDIIDLDLSITRKKRFRIDGDNDKILELNTSDLNIIARLDDTMEKLSELENEVVDSDGLNEDDTELSLVADRLKTIDNKMREYVDYIFDSNVSELCAGNGSMYDPFGGKMRYEHIIDTLISLYDANLKKEAISLKNRVEKKTAKYTKKGK